MPPIPPPPPPLTLQLHPLPRIILYQQTHHHGPNNAPISLLPLLTAQKTPALTHIILAAVHLNPPSTPNSEPHLTLNDHPPSDPRFTQLWDEVLLLQDSSIKVHCMLGGAARGSFACLDYSASELLPLPQLSTRDTRLPRLPPPKNFERYYRPLRDFIREHGFQGIDLDVEEDMSLEGIVQLVDRLREDFGASSGGGFVITLAPVATALIRGYKHLSGFSYFELERLRGEKVDWYNVQFYNGWGSLEYAFPQPLATSSTLPSRAQAGWYDIIITGEKWRPDRLVMGLLTNPRHGGSGYVGWDVIARKVGELVERYPGFGGVCGWEYWGAVPELEGGEVEGSRAGREGTVGGGQWQVEGAGAGRMRVGGEEAAEEESETHYWRWAWRMKWILSLREIRDHAVVVAAARSLAGLQIPNAQRDVSRPP